MSKIWQRMFGLHKTWAVILASKMFAHHAVRNICLVRILVRSSVGLIQNSLSCQEL